jgi:hypothetical protein
MSAAKYCCSIPDPKIVAGLVVTAVSGAGVVLSTAGAQATKTKETKITAARVASLNIVEPPRVQQSERFIVLR